MYPFRCTRCNYSTRNEFSFKQHVKTHSRPSYFSYFFQRKPYVPRDEPSYIPTTHRRRSEKEEKGNNVKSEIHQIESRSDKVKVISPIKPTTPPTAKPQSTTVRPNIQCEHCDYTCKFPYIMRKHLNNKHDDDYKKKPIDKKETVATKKNASTQTSPVKKMSQHTINLNIRLQPAATNADHTGPSLHPIELCLGTDDEELLLA